ncbi:MAG: HAD-IIIC family phosphatase [Nitrososphaerota archaeon]|nr:HAD-IIIC family phosphatase [Candidatus Bathyarchaeota archaeon]MDW8049036.1 HAD-IIIC family phosphatase [Nitrososphaerota archaeon]
MSREEVFGEISKILQTVRQDPSYLNYWHAYKKIQNLARTIEIPERRGVRIALLSSFTIEPLVACLDIECRLAGLNPEIYVAPFGQYSQDIIDMNSRLYIFKPDIILVAIDAESLLKDDFFSNFPKIGEEEKRIFQNEVIEHLTGLISKLTSQTNALVLLTNFIVPVFSPFGILDSKIVLGLKEFFVDLNTKLCNIYRESRQVYVFDLEGLAAKHGKERCVEAEMRFRGSILLSRSFMPLVAKEIAGYVKALKNLTRKCIVVDLDNVLWGGILGEDGFDGIKLGSDPVGKAYVDFQKLLLSYYNRGIILAINSKNNYEDAMKVIREHPNMILREKHFAAMRINWKDKVENMIELAQELNIGLDSMVFVDDSPQERERIRQALPQVLVLEVPSSPFRYAEALMELNDFNTLAISEEDKLRGEMYYAERKRRDLMKSVSNIEDFLRSLDMTAEIRYADSFSVPRITSLINRTNQFNLTTRRRTQVEVERICSEKDKYLVYSMRVTDRFGDEGIVGVAIIKKGEKEWIIDTFLLSCRVIGRRVETVLLARIIEDARRSGVSFLIGEYIPTEKNQVAKSFYSDHGFKFENEEQGVMRWRLNLQESTVKMPDWVKVI